MVDEDGHVNLVRMFNLWYCSTVVCTGSTTVEAWASKGKLHKGPTRLVLVIKCSCYRDFFVTCTVVQQTK